MNKKDIFSILIIDDAYFIRNLLSKSINSKPQNDKYEFKIVAQCENGEEGLDLYKIVKPDIVLLDINMTKMNGFKVIENIKKIKKNQQIIVCSSNTDEEVKKQIESQGFYFLQKPFQNSYLWNRLDFIANNLLHSNEINYDLKKIEEELNTSEDLQENICSETENQNDEKKVNISNDVNKKIFSVDRSKIQKKIDMSKKYLNNKTTIKTEPISINKSKKIDSNINEEDKSDNNIKDLNKNINTTKEETNNVYIKKLDNAQNTSYYTEKDLINNIKYNLILSSSNNVTIDNTNENEKEEELIDDINKKETDNINTEMNLKDLTLENYLNELQQFDINLNDIKDSALKKELNNTNDVYIKENDKKGEKVKIIPPKNNKLSEIYSSKMKEEYNIKVISKEELKKQKEKKHKGIFSFFSKLFKRK